MDERKRREGTDSACFILFSGNGAPRTGAEPRAATYKLAGGWRLVNKLAFLGPLGPRSPFLPINMPTTLWLDLC